MTATIRKQIERSTRKARGEKRVEVYLTPAQLRAVENWMLGAGLKNHADAVRHMIEAHTLRPDSPWF